MDEDTGNGPTWASPFLWNRSEKFHVHPLFSLKSRCAWSSPLNIRKNQSSKVPFFLWHVFISIYIYIHIYYTYRAIYIYIAVPFGQGFLFRRFFGVSPRLLVPCWQQLEPHPTVRGNDWSIHPFEWWGWWTWGITSYSPPRKTNKWLYSWKIHEWMKMYGSYGKLGDFPMSS